MLQYCLGFMLDESLEDVCLVLKNRPEMLKGKFNGIGGKLENNETPIESMVREFEEETGVYTEPNEWQSLGFFLYEEIQIHTFYCVSDKLYNCVTMEDEEIYIMKLDAALQRSNLCSNVLPCLNTIITETNNN